MKTYINIFMCILVVGLSILINRILLRGGSVVDTHNNPTYSATQRALVASSEYNPIIGLDYKISATKFFDNKMWVVVSIQPINNYSDPGKVVLKLSNNRYVVAAGPGSSFTKSDIPNAPVDVLQYIGVRP